MRKVLAEIIGRIIVSTVSLFLWASAVVGFFTGITDFVQYFRYSCGFPESSFTMNLLAGIAAFLMFGFSLKAVMGFRRNSSYPLSGSMLLSSAMAFVLAFLPRPCIGSAIRPDLFIYLGGLGVLASLSVYLSTPSPDTPDNTP
ncbi:MAG: hypothetical protein K8S62_15545 [Candidatus Sabulitectum sp.]|nr:hypothetical protein [Candidatus Sabulitectum sp.]